MARAHVVDPDLVNKAYSGNVEILFLALDVIRVVQTC